MCGTGTDQRVFAVVSGYITQAASATVPTSKTPASKTRKTVMSANVNSGFIVAYDISLAVDAIKKELYRSAARDTRSLAPTPH